MSSRDDRIATVLGRVHLWAPQHGAVRLPRGDTVWRFDPLGGPRLDLETRYVHHEGTVLVSGNERVERITVRGTMGVEDETTVTLRALESLLRRWSLNGKARA